MTLKLISTTEVLFEGEVTMVTLPGAMGRFTVLKNHASLLSTLVPGVIEYRAEAGLDESEGRFDVNGGVADVDNNVISVCVY